MSISSSPLTTSGQSKKNSPRPSSERLPVPRVEIIRRSRRGRCRDTEPRDDRLRVRKRRARETRRAERSARAENTREREGPSRGGDGGDGGSRLVITRRMDLRAIASGRFVTIGARK